jgi:hypothetical protein
MPTPQDHLLLKGAIVKIDPRNSDAEYILFQANQAKMHRSLQPKMVGGDLDEHSESVRFTGAPVEVLSFIIEIDVSLDHFTYEGKNSSNTISKDGIYPQLYALETLLYPTLSSVEKSSSQLSAGVIEIAPFAVPTVLLVWGPAETIPVSITSFSIIEQNFDCDLNPIHATVSLEATVLECTDEVVSSVAYQSFMSDKARFKK